MENTYQKRHIIWQGQQIEISVKENYSEAVKRHTGFEIMHIKIEAKSPLPITHTGFLSLILRSKTIEKAGRIEAYVKEQLDGQAKDPEWKAYVVKRNQLSLF